MKTNLLLFDPLNFKNLRIPEIREQFRTAVALFFFLLMVSITNAQTPNQLPTATVVQLEDQTPSPLITENEITGVDGNVIITLEGSGDDPDGDNTALTYSWTQVGVASTPPLVLADANTTTATFTTPARTMSEQNLAFQLIVTDAEGASSENLTAIVSFKILRLPNQLPTASIAPIDSSLLITEGSDTGVGAGVTITLEGSGDDPDGDNTALTYSWTQVGVASTPPLVLADANTASATFTTPARADGVQDLVFQLIVTDELGLSSENHAAIVSIMVLPNRAPIAVATTTTPEVVVERNGTQPAVLDGSGSSDLDGDTLTYSWTQTGGSDILLPSGGSFSATGVNPTITIPGSVIPVGSTETMLTFELTATDSDGDRTSTDSVTITVLVPDNRAPIANAGEDQIDVLPGATVVLMGSSSTDPDGHTLTYAWRQVDNGMPPVTIGVFTSTNQNPTITIPETTPDGDLVFELTVTEPAAPTADGTPRDPSGLTDTDTVTITVARTLSTDDFSTKNINVFSTSNRTLRITGLNNEKADVTLFDILGRMALQTTISSGNSEINFSRGIKTGIYIVRINTLKGNFSKKIFLK